MILNLVQASSAPQVTDMCKDAGIPVVYINREPDTAEEERWASDSISATYVGADARQSGTYQGEEIVETANKGDINGDGKSKLHHGSGRSGERRCTVQNRVLCKGTDRWQVWKLKNFSFREVTGIRQRPADRSGCFNPVRRQDRGCFL